MGKRNKSFILSFKALRRLIGILGMVLPLVCFLGGLLFGGESLRRSISAYYYTNVRDFFGGLMICMSFFMMTYKGYERIDTIANLAAGLSGIGVGLFPCLLDAPDAPVGFFQLRESCSNIVHVACAGTFFVILALSSLFLFTRKREDRMPTERKLLRNIVYRICGWVMIATLVGILIVMIFLSDSIQEKTRIVFFAETILLEAFGISWLVKGEAILKDR